MIDPMLSEEIAEQSAVLEAETINETTNKIKSVTQWPMKGKITTHFGVPHWPFQPTHTGLDISDGRGSGSTPVKPFKFGRVIKIVYSYTGLGKHVLVDHGNGISSLYGHLDSIKVRENQDVDLNTVLGYAGSSGVSTGTHLHFEIMKDGNIVDPRQYIDGHP